MIIHLLTLKLIIMSKFNLEKDNWLEVVFIDKNKNYGAYQLRKENNQTLLKSLLLAIAFFGSAILLLSFTTNKEEKIKDKAPTLKPAQKYIIKEVFFIKERQKVFKGEKNTKKNIEKPVSDKIVLTNDKTAKPDDGKKTTDPYNPNGNENGDNTIKKPEGNPIGNSKDPADKPNDQPIKTNNTIVIGKEASFPGGIEKFREYIKEKFELPEDQEVKSVVLQLYFVVDTNGKLSNIRVVNAIDKDLADEAIRVLKSLKTKWEPGSINGKPVNSEKSLKIEIKYQ
jgi:periplasmic protein TonB